MVRSYDTADKLSRDLRGGIQPSKQTLALRARAGRQEAYASASMSLRRLATSPFLYSQSRWLSETW